MQKCKTIHGENKTENNKPLIGFFPLFYNLAETGRALLIAKRYQEHGGKVIFFSHGGEYEYIVQEHRFPLHRVEPIYTTKFIDLLWKSSRLETLTNPFTKEILHKHIQSEIQAFTATRIQILLTTNNFPSIISSRAANIPLIFVTPKLSISCLTYPDAAETIYTYFIPHKMKLKIFNFYAPHSKMYVRSFAKVAKKYKVPAPRIAADITKGDYTFYTDCPEIISEPNPKKNEFYIGPIFLDELFNTPTNQQNQIIQEHELLRHIQSSEKSILVTLGSSGTKKLFLSILEALNKTPYKVIAVYGSILKEHELPKTNQHIRLVQSVPSIKKFNGLVDLAIIHGGQGTVYTAAYAGKPVIGFSMQFEQHMNLEHLVNHGTGIILSRRYFKQKKLTTALNKIFDNYDKYLANAQRLANKLPAPQGDKNAVDLILKLFCQTKNNN